MKLLRSLMQRIKKRLILSDVSVERGQEKGVGFYNEAFKSVEALPQALHGIRILLPLDHYHRSHQASGSDLRIGDRMRHRATRASHP